MMAADKESEQKAKLINYFDEMQNPFRLTSQVAKLQALQNPLGASLLVEGYGWQQVCYHRSGR